LVDKVGGGCGLGRQNRFQTQWEQLDEEEGYQYNRKALNTIPVLLFLLAVTKTSHDNTHFMLNFLALAICIVPKMNVMREILATKTF